MAGRGHRAIIQHIFEAGFNQGELSVLEDQVALSKRKELKEMIVMLRMGFADLHCTIEDEIQDGGKIAVQWRLRGTHTGVFLGNQPTDRSIDVQGILHARIVNGQITEALLLLNQMALMQQLGLLPPTTLIGVGKRKP